MKEDTSHDDERRGAAELPIRRVPLSGVLVGAGVLAAGMVCLYLVMREVGIDQGGACASGGPYEIREGQECQSGVFALGFGGAIGGSAGALFLIWSSWRLGRSLMTTAASAACFGGFFGGLGGSFLSLGGEPSVAPETRSEYTTVGWIFVAMAVMALPVVFGPLVYSIRTRRPDVVKPTLHAWLGWFAALVVGAVAGVAITALVA